MSVGAIKIERLLARLQTLGTIGALPGGGVCRLALTDEDRAGREQLRAWMDELDLTVTVDAIGNMFGVRGGGAGAPVVIGSHIDTVATGGLYDGALGVLAGLEVIACLNEREQSTARPIAVAAFTNEEGARFAPDMMGSAAYTGALPLDDMLQTVGIDGTSVGAELARIGFAGDAPMGWLKPAAFLELHIEQGPVLEAAGTVIGVVEGVQGISWTEFTINGVASHAGTTPMSARRDAGLVAAKIGCLARQIARDAGPPQVATVGALTLSPGLVNVVPEQATMTVDLRHTDEPALQAAERALMAGARAAAAAEGCTISERSLARFHPVAFDSGVRAAIEAAAKAHGLTAMALPSGAGHDAQMFAPHCPTGMIFVPSRDGLSHNVAEYTEPAHIEAGANVLLAAALRLADAPI